MIALGDDAAETGTLPDFRLETHMAKWEFAARYHATASDIETISVRTLLALAGDQGLERLLYLKLGYAESCGSPSLRAAIAATYTACQMDDIVCFAGAQEGIYCLYHSLLTADDHAIVVTPNYQSAESVPLSICAVTGVPLDEAQGWTLHPDALEAAIRPNTRVISINFPHNPTGKILERDRFDAIVELCRKNGIWLFSDEVYSFIEHDPTKRLPQAADVYERGISLNVLSKSYGLPGLRVGWVACRDRRLLERAVRLKHYLSICNSGPSELLAQMALAARETLLERARQIMREGYLAAQAFLAERPDLFETYAPDGGVVMFPRFKGAQGVEAFCRDLVEQAGVLLLPSSIYRSALTPTPLDRFRIGYGRLNARESFAAMRDFLAAKPHVSVP